MKVRPWVARVRVRDRDRGRMFASRQAWRVVDHVGFARHWSYRPTRRPPPLRHLHHHLRVALLGSDACSASVGSR
jgi:hypothetical protein